MRILFLLARVLLAAVFFCAGAIKTSASAQFALALIPFATHSDNSTPIIPPDWLGPISHILPIVEIIAAFLLVLPWTKRIGALLIFLLCAAFISILGWALSNNIIVACSCFGQDDTPSAPAMVFAMVRDILLALVAIVVLFEKRLLPNRNPLAR